MGDPPECRHAWGTATSGATGAIDTLRLDFRLANRSNRMPDLPTPEDIDEASRALQLGASVAELHGGLCGWLAGGGEDTAAWPARVLADPGIEGLEFAEGATAEDRQQAEARYRHHLLWLLRRFVDPAWIEERLGERVE